MSETSESIHRRTCPLCEGMCGLRIHVNDGRVDRIRPDPDDVWSRGYMCPKGATLGDLHHDPDRLRTPLVKRDGEFVEASWEEAFAECERLLHPVIERYGRDAVVVHDDGDGVRRGRVDLEGVVSERVAADVAEASLEHDEGVVADEVRRG